MHSQNKIKAPLDKDFDYVILSHIRARINEEVRVFVDKLTPNKLLTSKEKKIIKEKVNTLLELK